MDTDKKENGRAMRGRTMVGPKERPCEGRQRSNPRHVGLVRFTLAFTRPSRLDAARSAGWHPSWPRAGRGRSGITWPRLHGARFMKVERPRSQMAVAEAVPREASAHAACTAGQEWSEGQAWPGRAPRMRVACYVTFHVTTWSRDRNHAAGGQAASPRGCLHDRREVPD